MQFSQPMFLWLLIILTLIVGWACREKLRRQEGFHALPPVPSRAAVITAHVVAWLVMAALIVALAGPSYV